MRFRSLSAFPINIGDLPAISKRNFITREVFICFAAPRDDKSICIAISVADIVGFFLINSNILSELFSYVSELSVHPL